jgi:hypothetical protein
MVFEWCTTCENVITTKIHAHTYTYVYTHEKPSHCGSKTMNP